MRSLIEQFQRGENKEVIQRVLALIELDLKAIKESGEELPEGDLFFVAYRIRALLMKNALQSMNYHNKYHRQERRSMYMEFQGYIKSLFNVSEYAERDEYGILKVGFDEYANELGFECLEPLEYYFNFHEIVNEQKYDSLFENSLELMTLFPNDYQRILELAKEFQDTSKNSETFKKFFEMSKERLLPHLIPALEYALHKVDSKRTPKEVVRYVNKAMLTKYIELFQESEGKKRIYDPAAKKTHYVDPSFNVDPWLLLLIWDKKGHTLSWVGVDAFDIYLAKSQKEFLLDVYQAVKEELEKENREAFRWSKNGEPIIKKRYFAEKLVISEANFKMKMRNIVKVIQMNWREALSKK
ncbi:hypothetical protein [Cytobacillus oceanisediminis]|uniref:hypothetical protein n=1 Tax=Cytobacillus oceanisediminis TaxID=665099 RepID=UPI00207A506A|nr:hypothetical protein [Cytobacillus oceanisediminis]USK45809.1 hypothetical protein LIT27_08155 [Cytobacillus oceanisediminis]